MKPAFFAILICLLSFSCKKTETDNGAIDTETIARKLFDTLRNGDFERSESLMPDKGTYRKILKEWKNIDAEEQQYDLLLSSAEKNFTAVQNMVADWQNTKYSNVHTDLGKEGILQIAKATTKFDLDGQFYKYSFTICKYNGRWFYLGDAMPVAKES